MVGFLRTEISALRLMILLLKWAAKVSATGCCRTDNHPIIGVIIKFN